MAEAQGAELIKVRNFTPATQSYNHFQSMRDGANALQNNLTQFRQLVMQLRSIDPKAAEAADRSFRPLTESASLRVELVRRTEQMIIELSNTGNATRLQGVPLQQGRDSANLVSNQLRTMNMNLVPQQLAQGNDLLARIRALPASIAEARDELKRIVGMVAVTARAALQAGRSAMTRALNAVSEMLVAFGSRFTVFLPPIPTDQLKSWGPRSSTDA